MNARRLLIHRRQLLPAHPLTRVCPTRLQSSIHERPQGASKTQPKARLVLAANQMPGTAAGRTPGMVGAERFGVNGEE